MMQVFGGKHGVCALAKTVLLLCCVHISTSEHSPPRRVPTSPARDGVVSWRLTGDDTLSFAASPPRRSKSPHRVRVARCFSCPSIHVESKPEDFLLSNGLISTKEVSSNIAAKLRIQNHGTGRAKEDLGNELLTLVQELEEREQIREDQEAALLSRLKTLEVQMQVGKESVEEQSRRMQAMETRAIRAEKIAKALKNQNLQQSTASESLDQNALLAKAVLFETNISALQTRTEDVMAKLETSRQKAWDAFSDFGALSESVHAVIGDNSARDSGVAQQVDFAKQLQTSFSKVSDLGMELEASHASLEKHKAEMEDCLHKLQAAASETGVDHQEEVVQSGMAGWLSFLGGSKTAPEKRPGKSPGKSPKKVSLNARSADQMQKKRVATLRTALQITLAHGHVDKDKASLVKAVNRLCKDASTTRRTCRLLRKWKQKAEVADMRSIILKKKMDNELSSVTTQLKAERARVRRIVKAREMEWQMATQAVKAKNEMNATLQEVKKDLTSQICAARERLCEVISQADANRTAAEGIRCKLMEELAEARLQLEQSAEALSRNRQERKQLSADSDEQLTQLQARVQELKQAEDRRRRESEEARSRIQYVERAQKLEADESHRRETQGMQTVKWQSKMLTEARWHLDDWKQRARRTTEALEQLKVDLLTAQHGVLLEKDARQKIQKDAETKISSLEARAASLEKETLETQRILRGLRAREIELKSVNRDQMAEVEAKNRDLAAQLKRAQKELTEKSVDLERAQTTHNEKALEIQKDLEEAQSLVKEMEAQLANERAEKEVVGKEKDAAVAEAEMWAQELQGAHRKAMNEVRKGERQQELENEASRRKEVQGKQTAAWQSKVLQETQKRMQAWKEAAERSISRLEVQARELHATRSAMEAELQHQNSARQESAMARHEIEENIRLARTILEERQIMLRAATLAAQGNATKLEQVETELRRTKDHLDQILAGPRKGKKNGGVVQQSELDAANQRLKATELALERVTAEKIAADKALAEAKEDVERKAQEVAIAEEKGRAVEAQQQAKLAQLLAKGKRAEEERQREEDTLRRREFRAMQIVAWQSRVLFEAEDRLKAWTSAALGNMSRADELEAKVATVLGEVEAQHVLHAQQLEKAEAAAAERERELQRKVDSEATRLGEKEGLERKVETLAKKLDVASQRCAELEAEKVRLWRESTANISKAEKTQRAATESMRAEMEQVRLRLMSELETATSALKEVEMRLEGEMSAHKSLEAKILAAQEQLALQSKRAENAESIAAEKQRVLEAKAEVAAALKREKDLLERKVEGLVKELGPLSPRAKSQESSGEVNKTPAKGVDSTPEKAQASSPAASARSVMDKLRRRVAEQLDAAKESLKQGELKLQSAEAEREAATREKEQALAEVERRMTELRETEKQRVEEVAALLAKVRFVEGEREAQADALRRLQRQSKQTKAWQYHMLSDAQESVNTWRAAAQGNMSRVVELQGELERATQQADVERMRERNRREQAEAALVAKERELQQRIAAEAARLEEKEGVKKQVEALGKQLKAATRRCEELQLEKSRMAKQSNANSKAEKARAAASESMREEMEGVRARLSSELMATQEKLKQVEEKVAEAVASREAVSKEKDAAVSEVERKAVELQEAEARVAEALRKVTEIEQAHVSEADTLRRREVRAMQTVAWQSEKLSMAEGLVEELREGNLSMVNQLQKALEAAVQKVEVERVREVKRRELAEAAVAKKARALENKVAAEAAMQSENEDMKKRVKALGKELREATRRCKELEAQSAALKSKADSAQSAAAKATKATMEEARNQLSSELEAAQAKLKDGEVKLVSVMAEREVAWKEKEAAMQEVDQKTIELRAAEERRAHEVAEVLAMARGLERAREGEEDRQRRRETCAVQTMAWQSQRLAVANRVVEEWREAAQGNMSRAVQLQAALDAAKQAAGYEQERKAKQRDLRVAEERELHAVSAEAGQLKKRVEAMGKQLRQATRRCKELEAESKANLSQVEQAQAAEVARVGLSSELEEARKQLGEANRKMLERETKLKTAVRKADAERAREVKRRETAEAALKEKQQQLEKKVAAEAARRGEKGELEKRVETLGKELDEATRRCKQLESEKTGLEKASEASLSKAEKARDEALEAMRTELEGVRAGLSSELAQATTKLEAVETQLKAAMQERQAAVADVDRKAVELRQLEDRLVEEVAAAVRKTDRRRDGEADMQRRREVRALQTVAWQSEKERELLAASADADHLKKRVEVMGKQLRHVTRRCQELEVQRSGLEAESQANLSQVEQAQAAETESLRAEMELSRARLSSELEEARKQLGEANRKMLERETKLKTAVRKADAERAREVKRRETAEAALKEKQQQLEKKVAAEAARRGEKGELEKRVETLGKELDEATRRCKQLESEKTGLEKASEASLSKAEKARDEALEAMRTELEGVRAGLSSELAQATTKLEAVETQLKAAMQERQAAVADVDRKAVELRQLEDRLVEEVAAAVRKTDRRRDGEADMQRRREVRALQTVAWQSEKLSLAEGLVEELREAVQGNMTRVAQLQAELETAIWEADARRVREVKRRELAEATVAQKEKELELKVAAEAARQKETQELQRRVETLGKEVKAATRRSQELEAQSAKDVKIQSQAEQARAAATESMRAGMESVRMRLSAELETAQAKLKEGEEKLQEAVAEREAAKKDREAAVVVLEKKVLELRRSEERRVHEVAEALKRAREAGEPQAGDVGIEWFRSVKRRELAEAAVAEKARQFENASDVDEETEGLEQRVEVLVKELGQATKRCAELEEEKQNLGKETESSSASARSLSSELESTRAQMEGVRKQLSSELEAAQAKLKEGEAQLATLAAEREAARQQQGEAMAEVERKTLQLRSAEEMTAKRVGEAVRRVRAVELSRESEVDGLRRREVRATQTVAWQAQVLAETEAELGEWRAAAQGNTSRAAKLQLTLEAANRAVDANWFREVKQAELAESVVAEKEQELEKQVLAEAARLEDMEGLEKRVEALGNGLLKATKRCKELEAEKARMQIEIGNEAGRTQSEIESVRAAMVEQQLRLSEQLNSATGQLKDRQEKLEQAVAEREAARKEKEAAASEVERKMLELREAEEKRMEDVDAAMNKVRYLQREKEAEGDALRRKELRAMQLVSWQSKVLAESEKQLAEWRTTAHHTTSKAAELESRLSNAGQASEALRLEEVKRREVVEAALVEKERELAMKVAEEEARLVDRRALEKRVEAFGKELMEVTNRCKHLQAEKESATAAAKQSISDREAARLAEAESLLAQVQDVRMHLSAELEAAQAKLTESDEKLSRAVSEREAARQEKKSAEAQVRVMEATVGEVEGRMVQLRAAENMKLKQLEYSLQAVRHEMKEREAREDVSRRKETQLAQTMAWQSTVLLGTQKGLDNWRTIAQSTKKNMKQLRKRAMHELAQTRRQMQEEVARKTHAEAAAIAKVAQLERLLVEANDTVADQSSKAQAAFVEDELRHARQELAVKTAELETARDQTTKTKNFYEGKIAGLETKLRTGAANLERVMADREAARAEKEKAMEEVEERVLELKASEQARISEVEGVLAVALQGELEHAIEADALRRREHKSAQTVAWQAQVLEEAASGLEEWRAAANRAEVELQQVKAALASKSASLLSERAAHGRIQMLRNRLSKQTAHYKEQMLAKEQDLRVTQERIADLEEQVQSLADVAEATEAKLQAERHAASQQASANPESEDEGAYSQLRAKLTLAEDALAKTSAEKEQIVALKEKEEALMETLIGELKEMGEVSSKLGQDLEAAREELDQAEQRVEAALAEKEAAEESEKTALENVERKKLELKESELRRMKEVGMAMQMKRSGDRTREVEMEEARRRETQVVQTVTFQSEALSSAQKEMLDWREAFHQSEAKLKKALEDYEVQMRLEEHRRHSLKASNARRCQILEQKLFAETVKRQETAASQASIVKASKQVMSAMEVKLLRNKMERIAAKEDSQSPRGAESGYRSAESPQSVSSSGARSQLLHQQSPPARRSRRLLDGIASIPTTDKLQSRSRAPQAPTSVAEEEVVQGGEGLQRVVWLEKQIRDYEERVQRAEGGMKEAAERERKLMAEQKWYAMAHTASEQKWKEMDGRSHELEKELADVRLQLKSREGELSRAKAEKDALAEEKVKEELLLERLMSELREMEEVSSRLGEELADVRSQLARGDWERATAQDVEQLERKREVYRENIDSLRAKVRQMLECEVEKVEREREQASQTGEATECSVETCAPQLDVRFQSPGTRTKRNNGALEKQINEMKALADLGRSLSEEGDLAAMMSTRNANHSPEAYDTATPLKHRPAVMPPRPDEVNGSQRNGVHRPADSQNKILDRLSEKVSSLQHKLAVQRGQQPGRSLSHRSAANKPSPDPKDRVVDFFPLPSPGEA